MPSRRPPRPRLSWGPRFGLLGILLFATGARADVVFGPSQIGTCAGAEGTVCRVQIDGKDLSGVCRRSRTGEIFCATDPDSAERAERRRDELAERSRRETTWVLGVLSVLGLSLVGLVIFLLRKRRARSEEIG